MKNKLKEIPNKVHEILFVIEEPNIYQRIARVFLYPIFFFCVMIGGIIFLVLIRLLLPLCYFAGGFLIDVFIYIVTGKMLLLYWYEENMMDT